MPSIIMYFSALCGVGLIVYMLIKNLDVKISLFFVGIVLMFVALMYGNPIGAKGFNAGGFTMLVPLEAIIYIFKDIIVKSGFIILILGGYATYMNAIKANDATVSLLLKPIKLIKSPYLLVPVVFLIGNMLSMVIPSASNLAIILLATIYPIMRKAGLSALSSAAVIATTATIVPTPLGSDNIAVVKELNNLEMFKTLTPSDYVFNYHAKVSIPTIIFMAVVHFLWQKYCDKKNPELGNEGVKQEEDIKLDFSPVVKVIYGILPLLPIVLLLVLSCFEAGKNVGIEVVIIFSIIAAIVCELIRSRDFKSTLDKTQEFFKGMGGAMPIVALLVAGSTFVTGLKSIGIINALQAGMTGMQASGFGFVLPLILVLLTILIVVLSGSGIALFFAMVPLFVPLAEAANIDVMSIAIPMGLAGNLIRSISPVSAVIMIVAGSTGKTPFEIVKRTSVPMLSGTVFMFILSMFYYM